MFQPDVYPEVFFSDVGVVAELASVWPDGNVQMLGKEMASQLLSILQFLVALWTVQPRVDVMNDVNVFGKLRFVGKEPVALGTIVSQAPPVGWQVLSSLHWMFAGYVGQNSRLVFVRFAA